MVGYSMSIDEVIGEIEKDTVFYRRSDGGVTVTGGEPLLQAEFVRLLLQECRRKGIHTALETCGYCPWTEFKQVLEYVDQVVLYDIKHMDSKIHKALTGVANGLILENARKVVELGKEVIIRVPVIQGCTDSLENIEAIVKFAKSLRKVKEVHLLPYHRLGELKYEKMGREYKLRGTKPFDKNSLVQHQAIIESHELVARIGG
jgi:pyruvate formate lyase activating enzyme